MKRLLPWFREGIDPNWMLRYWDSSLNCCLKTRRYLLTCHSDGVQCVVCSAQTLALAKQEPVPGSHILLLHLGQWHSKAESWEIHPRNNLASPHKGWARTCWETQYRCRQSAALYSVIFIRWMKHVRICRLRWIEPFRASFKKEERTHLFKAVPGCLCIIAGWIPAYRSGIHSRTCCTKAKDLPVKTKPTCLQTSPYIKFIVHLLYSHCLCIQQVQKN